MRFFGEGQTIETVAWSEPNPASSPSTPLLLDDFRICEGQTFPTRAGPASGNLQGTKPRGGARVSRCPRVAMGNWTTGSGTAHFDP